MEGMNRMSNLEVLYEDNHLIAVNKPRNVLSQGDKTNDLDLLTMTKQYLKQKYQKPGNVYLGLLHRLDRPVSGVMVFAKTSKAASRMSEEIRTHRFQKTYLAIVHGTFSSKEGVFEDYLQKLENGNTIVTDSKHGKFSRLTYQVLEENKPHNLSLVKICLETGRHHQIRVQFASRNHPLCGDWRYGEKEDVPLCLHAYQVSFLHPVKKEPLTIVSLPSKDSYWTLFTL